MSVLYLLFCFTESGLPAQLTRTSVAAGDWHDGSTWSPSGLPGSTANETIVVSHKVYANDEVTFNGSASYLEVKPGGKLFLNGPPTGGNPILGSVDIHNEGFLNIYAFFNPQGDILNEGRLVTGFTSMSMGVRLVNRGELIALSDFYIEDSLVNDGYFKVYWLENYGLLEGNGEICVTDLLANTGHITGNLSICGEPGYYFSNGGGGVIDSTVQICTTPVTCEEVMALDPTRHDLAWEIWPLPADEVIHIRLPEPERARNFTLYRMDGLRLFEVLSPMMRPDQSYTLFPGELPPGTYLLRLETESGRWSSQTIILH